MKNIGKSWNKRVQEAIFNLQNKENQIRSCGHAWLLKLKITLLDSRFKSVRKRIHTFPWYGRPFAYSSTRFPDNVVLQMFLFLGLGGKLQVNMTWKLSEVSEPLGSTANAVSTEPQHGNIVLLIRQKSSVYFSDQHHTRQHWWFCTHEYETFRSLHWFTTEVCKSKFSTCLAQPWEKRHLQVLIGYLNFKFDDSYMPSGHPLFY